MNPGDAFASAFHREHLKPKGFKKTGHTFSRVYADYGEHYNIQGSAWNSAGQPWLFYVNCAISFPDIPVPKPGSGMYRYHAHTRLESLVSTAPSGYTLSEQNQAALLVQLSEYIWECSRYFARRHGILKESFLAHRFEMGFLHDPELRTNISKRID